MNYYFSLQIRILNRKFSAFGITPLLGYLLSAFMGILGSSYLFQQTEYAPIIFVILALGLISQLSERQRNEFLRRLFPVFQYRIIRLQENFIVAFPFSLFLGFQAYWLYAGGLLIMAGLLALISIPANARWVVPTPFFRHPFEFIVGFRSAYLFYFLAYFLSYQAIQVDNFNLGIFALLLTFLLSMTFYFSPESPYFVWIYTQSPHEFLWRKVLAAVHNSTWLSLPCGVLLGFTFPENLAIIGGVQLLGYLLLMTIIFAKYAAFPAEMNLPQAFILALGLWLPPMLLVIIPYFYRQALQRLQPLLP